MEVLCFNDEIPVQSDLFNLFLKRTKFLFLLNEYYVLAIKHKMHWYYFRTYLISEDTSEFIFCTMYNYVRRHSKCCYVGKFTLGHRPVCTFSGLYASVHKHEYLQSISRLKLPNNPTSLLTTPKTLITVKVNMTWQPWQHIKDVVLGLRKLSMTLSPSEISAAFFASPFRDFFMSNKPQGKRTGCCRIIFWVKHRKVDFIRTITWDLWINVPALYQLSYLALCWRSPYFVNIFVQGS